MTVNISKVEKGSVKGLNVNFVLEELINVITAFFLQGLSKYFK